MKSEHTIQLLLSGMLTWIGSKFQTFGMLILSLLFLMIIESTSYEFDYVILGIRYQKERNCMYKYSSSFYLLLFSTFICFYIPIYY